MGRELSGLSARCADARRLARRSRVGDGAAVSPVSRIGGLGTVTTVLSVVLDGVQDLVGDRDVAVAVDDTLGAAYRDLAVSGDEPRALEEAAQLRLDAIARVLGGQSAGRHGVDVDVASIEGEGLTGVEVEAGLEPP